MGRIASQSRLADRDEADRIAKEEAKLEMRRIGKGDWWWALSCGLNL